MAERVDIYEDSETCSKSITGENMKHILSFAFLFLLISAGLSGQVVVNGDITEHIDSLIGVIPDATPSGLYLQPGASSRTLWRSIIQNILNGNYAVADSLGESIEYQVTAFTDTVATPDKLYYILERQATSASRYWGTFVFNPSPWRPTLVIQCPHPLHDRKTGQQGFHAFRKTGAKAYFLSGTHRCNGVTASPCDGTTTACSETYDNYRYSDQAHVVLGPFQVTMEEMLTPIPNLIVIQPHGFSPEAGDPDIIMSNGTRYTPIDDYAIQLRDNLLLQDATLTFKVAHVDMTWDRLIGRDNTQGRLINGSADPCGTLATSTTGRFIHLEQVYTGLRDTEANWNKLANAIAATFPAHINFGTAQGGSWTDPDTWIGGLVPGPTDDVVISAGHTISVDDTLAMCKSVTFGGTDALIDLNAKSRLSIYGDFTLFSETHNVFSAGWSSDSAYVVFAGSAPAVISGFSTSAGSTSFRDLIIAKDSTVTVSTAGTGMRLGIQHSLDVKSGSFLLAIDDDLESRWSSSGNFTADQQLTITVQPGAEFHLVDGTGSHWVRSNTGSAPIGPMTIYGEAEFIDASSSDISLATINVKPGGTLHLNTGLGTTTSGAMFNPGTITVDSAGILLQETTSDIWFDTSVVILSRGGIYKTTSSTTVFPPTLVNDGRVRYQRNPSSATTDQVVIDTNYWDIEFSFAGNGTKKTWTLTDNRLVSDSLEVNNSAILVLAGSGQTIRVDSLLRMTSGQIDNSAGTANLKLGNGATISRATGTIAAAPQFEGVVNVRYTSSTTGVTTGPELPTATTTLRDLTVATPKGISLGANATASGTVHVADSSLLTGAYTLTLGPTATLIEDSLWSVWGRVQTTRTINQGVTQNFGGIGLEITAAGTTPGSTHVMRVTGTAQTLSTGNGILRYYTGDPSVTSGLNAAVVFHYGVLELNGLGEATLGLYQSLDSGASWNPLPGVIDTTGNFVSASGLDRLGWLTLGTADLGCCVGTVGNVDCSEDDGVDIGDLTSLINNLFIDFAPLCCDGEANCDGVGGIDIGDLTALINNLFITFAPLPDCSN